MTFVRVGLFFVGCFCCIEGKQYVCYDNKMNFTAAKTFCALRGMEVAIATNHKDINSMNKQLAYLNRKAEAWLGMVYTGKRRRFKWLNGDLVKIHRWNRRGDHEPDSVRQQKCAVWRRPRNVWDSRQCWAEYPVICADRSDNKRIAKYSSGIKNKGLKTSETTVSFYTSNIKCAVECKSTDICRYFTWNWMTSRCDLHNYVTVTSTVFINQTGCVVWRLY